MSAQLCRERFAEKKRHLHHSFELAGDIDDHAGDRDGDLTEVQLAMRMVGRLVACRLATTGEELGQVQVDRGSQLPLDPENLTAEPTWQMSDNHYGIMMSQNLPVASLPHPQWHSRRRLGMQVGPVRLDVLCGAPDTDSGIDIRGLQPRLKLRVSIQADITDVASVPWVSALMVFLLRHLPVFIDDIPHWAGSRPRYSVLRFEGRGHFPYNPSDWEAFFFLHEGKYQVMQRNPTHISREVEIYD